MKPGSGRPDSRKLRIARYTVRYYDRDYSRATNQQKRDVVAARYQRACALLVAHRLSTNQDSPAGNGGSPKGNTWGGGVIPAPYFANKIPL